MNALLLHNRSTVQQQLLLHHCTTVLLYHCNCFYWYRNLLLNCCSATTVLPTVLLSVQLGYFTTTILKYCVYFLGSYCMSYYFTTLVLYYRISGKTNSASTFVSLLYCANYFPTVCLPYCMPSLLYDSLLHASTALSMTSFTTACTTLDLTTV